MAENSASKEAKFVDTEVTRTRAPPKLYDDHPSTFSWVKPALHSRRTLKTFFRCCVALAATLTLLVADKPSREMGQAAFFSVIVAVMIPPSLPLILILVAIAMLLFGVSLGWAWGNAAMASALSVRDDALVAQQQQMLRSSLDPNISPQQAQFETQSAIFHGVFLDTRSSAVYGIFLFIGTFVLGVVRAKKPLLLLTTIFAVLALDLICTFGPLFFTPQYTLGKAFFNPTIFYTAVAAASSVLIFPQSQNHAWMSQFTDDFLTPMLDLLRLQSEVLSTKPSNHDTWTRLSNRGGTIRLALINGTDSLLGKLGTLGLDVSIGRLGSNDLKTLGDHMKVLMFRASGLQSFQAIVNDRNLFDKRLDALSEKRKAPGQPHRYQNLHRHIDARELEHGHHLDALVPILESTSEGLRAAVDESIEILMSWVSRCNDHRWASFLFPSKYTPADLALRHQALVDALAKLEAALSDFRIDQRAKIVKPFERFFDPETKRLRSRGLFASRSLFISFVFIDTLDAFAEQTITFLKAVIEIDEGRQKTKFWFPGRFQQVKDGIDAPSRESGGILAMGLTNDPTKFPSHHGSEASTASSSVEALDKEGKKTKADKKKIERKPAKTPDVHNPDAFPPKTGLGRFVLALAAIPRFLKSPEGIFAIKHAVLSIALWIPAVCKPTAWFYYDNKALWALIMGQTALAVYAGDQISDFVIRFVATLIGLVLGMAVWYIGAGRGDGNPYGIVIAATVFMAPFLFARIAAPPQQLGFWMLIPLTIIFVSGYSWVDTHQPSFSNPGVGYTVGWKRALLVVIGYAAAFIVMIFPNAVSSRVLVRKTMSATIAETGKIFAREVEAFLAEEALASRLSQSHNAETESNTDALSDTYSISNKPSAKERRIKVIGQRVLDVATRLRDLHPSLTTARFEPQLSGRWPHSEYEELFATQVKALQALILLISSFSKLDERWASIMIHKTPFLNPNFLSDIFTNISVISGALMHGHELPAYLPTLRERIVYHEHATGRDSFYQRAKGAPRSPRAPDRRPAQSELEITPEEDVRAAAEPAKVDGCSIGIETEEVTLDVLLDKNLPAHSTATIALSSFISRIDELTEIVRELCGQASFKGYDTLQRFYLDEEEKAVGNRTA